MLTTVQPSENSVDSNTSFQIAETFNSLQGEGAHTGEYSTFIRFNACNLKCPFCDTQEVMTHGKYKFTSEELIQAVESTSNIVFTGGEPTLPKYRQQMVEMIDIVLSEVVGLNRITTETNGVYLMQWADTLHSRYPHIKKDFSFSPKYYDQTTYENTLVYMQNIKNNYKKVSNSNIICKVVLDSERLTEFEEICNRWLKVFPKHTLYIMAMGDTVEKLRKTTKQALEYQTLYGCSFSPRLHIELGLK